MESDIFKAGVRPGSPGSEDEVKMLLCYVLTALEAEMDLDQLHEALSEHELVNYFELVRAVDKLTQTGHLSVQDEDCSPHKYAVTELGAQTGKEFEKSLPFSVREKAFNACRRLLARERRRNEVKVTQTPCQDGFLLELAIPDSGGELLSVQIFASSREDCERLKRNFLNAPLTVYKGVTALLTGDEQVLGKIFTREEALF